MDGWKRRDALSGREGSKTVPSSGRQRELYIMTELEEGKEGREGEKEASDSFALFYIDAPFSSFLSILFSSSGWLPGMPLHTHGTTHPPRASRSLPTFFIYFNIHAHSFSFSSSATYTHILLLAVHPPTHPQLQTQKQLFSSISSPLLPHSQPPSPPPPPAPPPIDLVAGSLPPTL